MYTLAREGDRTRFVLRTQHEADFGVSYDLRPEMLATFDEGKVVTTGVYSDRYGSWLSAYAPVRNKQGRVVALLEVDYKAEELAAILRRDAAQSAVVWLLGLTVTGLLALRLSRQIAEPLTHLTAAVDAAASGDESHELPTDAPAEIGLLVRRFGEMRDAVANARRQERLAVVGQMAGTMIHDLRGPLTVLMGMTELMQDEEDGIARKQLGVRVFEHINRIEAMARDVLDFSRGVSNMERSRFRAASVLESVAADLASIATRKGVVLRVDPEWDGLVWGDQEKLLRLAHNLVKNAIEATPAGRRVVVRTRAGAGRWQLLVEDEGTGISPQVAARLFEPFATHGKSGGTGLGLAMVKSVAETHGGSVTHAARPGGGTVFRVELPIDRREPGGQKQEAREQKAA
ncbi:MAG: HAMP domain-containing histidine kinase [Candidatus Wallbacteria bacterium]|nr:HAMP domain-containing histidine kinase [Candidatus Wallbacteria bacterium]